jgi:hypothetical protein
VLIRALPGADGLAGVLSRPAVRSSADGDRHKPA